MIENIGYTQIDLDINAPFRERLQAKQGEFGSRGIDVSLVDRREPVNSSGYDLVFVWKSLAGSVHERYAEEVDTFTGKYRISYPDKMLEGHGTIEAEIRVLKDGFNIASRLFDITVLRGLSTEHNLEDVQDGKKIISVALTDRGVPTSKNATFEQIVENIYALTSDGSSGEPSDENIAEGKKLIAEALRSKGIQYVWDDETLAEYADKIYDIKGEPGSLLLSSMDNMFRNMQHSFGDLSLELLATDYVTSMNHTFASDEEHGVSFTLNNLHVLETGFVSDFTGFLKGYGLGKIDAYVDISDINYGSATTLESMFENCALKVSSYGSGISFTEGDQNSPNVENMSKMFKNFDGTGGFGFLDISRFNSEVVNNMDSFLEGSKGLKQIDISGLSLSNLNSTPIPEDNYHPNFFKNSEVEEVYCKSQADIDKLKEGAGKEGITYFVGSYYQNQENN